MKFLFASLFIFVSSTIFGQDTITTKVIIFDEENMSDFTSESNEPYKKNAIKFNPLLIINGEIPLYYERAITNSFSLEGAIGITFKDYLGNAWDFIGDKGNSYSGESEEKIKNNISFKFGGRFYTGGIALDGFYFALEFAKRKYSKELSVTSNYYDPITSVYTLQNDIFNVEKSYSEFKIIAGSQEHSYWESFFVDYYFGVGINKQNNIELVSEFDSATGNENLKLINETKTAPSLYAGIKLGFEF